MHPGRFSKREDTGHPELILVAVAIVVAAYLILVALLPPSRPAPAVANCTANTDSTDFLTLRSNHDSADVGGYWWWFYSHTLGGRAVTDTRFDSVTTHENDAAPILLSDLVVHRDQDDITDRQFACGEELLADL